MPGADGVVCRPAIDSCEYVQPAGQLNPPITVASSALPIVSSAWAAGAAASSASIHATTTTLLMGRP